MMIELDPQYVVLVMFVGLLAVVMVGYPLAIGIGGVGLIVGYLLFGQEVLYVMYTRLVGLMMNYTLVAVPLFIYMGIMLQVSGMAEKMYDALYLWLGGLRGGLAITTIIIGTVLAATIGIIGASVTMLSLVALPAMMRRGYSRSLAAGSVCAGGCLGILIPPSIMLVVYGPMAGISVGKLFMAAFPAGLTLSALYCLYIGFRCLFQPSIAPIVPAEERAVPFVKKTVMLVSSLLPPSVLILAVLGTIFFGVAPPTEAAAVGAFAATILVIFYGRFSLAHLKKALLETLRVTSMVLVIAAISYAFVGVFLSAGGGKAVEDLILAVPGGRWGSFALVMFIVFLLGFLLDWLGTVFILVPIITPVLPLLGFDVLWFSMMIIVNFQTGFMTPPFAPAIFYVKGSADPSLGLLTSDVIRGCIPFILLILVALGLFIAFPDILLWLPSKMIK